MGDVGDCFAKHYTLSPALHASIRCFSTNAGVEAKRWLSHQGRGGKAHISRLGIGRNPALSQEERELNASDLLDNPPPVGEGAQSAGEGKDWVAGLGGGFQFCKLSAEPLFTALGQIRSDVTFAQLAEFVWFVETGTGFSPSPQPSPIKGEGAMWASGGTQASPIKGESAMLPSPAWGGAWQGRPQH